MILSEEIKNKIKLENEQWHQNYSFNSLEERQEKGQFFTPDVLVIKMLEKFSDLKGKILDPTLGSGALLAGAIIAGADPKKCYGIEIDANILKLAKKRLIPLGVPEKNLILGNALNPFVYDFQGDCFPLNNTLKGFEFNEKKISL